MPAWIRTARHGRPIGLAIERRLSAYLPTNTDGPDKTERGPLTGACSSSFWTPVVGSKADIIQCIATSRVPVLFGPATTGSRRVWRDLLADGVERGLHRIERMMRLQALRARPRRRRLPKDDGDRQVTHVPANLRIVSSWPTDRTRSGSPTLPTSGPRKAGSICRQ